MQTSLDQLHECPRCQGTGTVVDRETGMQQACRVCFGTGSVDYDPSDEAIPY